MSNIKRRIRTLEEKTGGVDPLIVYLNSFVVDPHGSPMCAIYLGGPNNGVRVDRRENESEHAFVKRARLEVPNAA